MKTPDVSAGIFKAYDIRGVVDETLTPSSVRWIGQAIGTVSLARGNSSVVVGRDGRLSGPRLVKALTTGILNAGADVIDIGMVPTPVVYFATEHLGTGASVSVTGSHNPPQYNGFKIMAGGETLSGGAITELHRSIVDGRLRHGSGTRHETSVTDAYLDRITAGVHLARPFKIAIDCGNGVAGAVAPELFRRLGCEVIELYTEVDGTFPNHHPDPIDETNLADLKLAVREENADFGIAFDGDGDRLGVVTPDGSTIWPDRQMILFARDILKRRPGAEIIFDVKCTRLLRQAIEESGGRATMYKTGHSLIKAKLKESGAALAGEMSGHMFFKERWYGFDDGLYAGARLCELLSTLSESPREVFAALPDSVNTPELRLELEEGDQHRLVAQLVANARFDDGAVCTIDGLRVDFVDGFGLARASNTTPTVIIRFEADD
ncbi:MAG: phosphomannomutase/phosphoglucomutase, partial [Proteobacteria bacterium]